MISMKRRKHMLYLFTIFLSMLSASIVLMPIGSKMKGESRTLMYVAGTMFWLGVVGTIYMMFETGYSGKKSSRFKENMGDLKQMGLTHFFQNIEATIADISMIIFALGFVISVMWIKKMFVSFILLAMLIFAFGMHCMLNGINYKYYKILKDKVRRDEES